MKSMLMEELGGIDPLPAGGEPPALADMLGLLDPAVRPLMGELHPVRQRPRAPRAAFATAALAGAGVAAALVLVDGGGGRLDVAQAILRATQPGSGVLHMSVVSERTVGSATSTTSEQIWTAQNPRRMRTVRTDSEETLEGALTTAPVRSQTWSSAQPDVIRQSTPSGVASSEESPVAIIHRLIAEGRATVAGETTYEGQAAWRLDIHPQTTPETLEGKQLPRPTLIVAAKTYVPLELSSEFVIEEQKGRPQLAQQRERYTEYEELPAAPQSESLLELAPHPEAKVQVEK